MKGKTHSTETKEKLSKLLKGRVIPEKERLNHKKAMEKLAATKKKK